MITSITETNELMGISQLNNVLGNNPPQTSLLEKTYDLHFALHGLILANIIDIMNAYFNDKFYDFKQQETK